MDCQIDMAASAGVISSHRKSNYFPSTVEPLHNGHFGDRGKWPLWGSGCCEEVGANIFFFCRGPTFFVQKCFF